MRYTRELLEPIVAASQSFAEVLRKLGVRQAGGAQSHVARRIRGFGLDTTHFLGKGHQKGKRAFYRSPWQLVLQPRPAGNRQKASLLRRAMIEAGIPYICASPGCS